MSHNNWTHHLVHAVGHQAQHERKKGNANGANALTVFGLSIVLMPFLPFIALPMLIGAIFKACSSGSSHESKS